MTRCLVTFDVTSMALMFERLCREQGIDARLAPVPRSISASCGLACQFPCELEDELRQLCRNKDIVVAGWHRMEQ